MRRISRPSLEWLLVRPWRLVVVVTVLVAAPLVLANEIAVRRSEASLAAETERTTRAAAERAAQVVDVWMSGLRGRLARMAESPDFREAVGKQDSSAIEKSIRTEAGRVLHGIDDVSGYLVLDPEGRAIFAHPGLAQRGVDLSGREYVSAAIKRASFGTVGGETVFVSGVEPGVNHPNTNRLVLSVPITFGLQPLAGVLAIEIQPRTLGPLVTPLLGEMADLYVIDRAGRTVVRARDPGAASRDLSQVAAVREVVAGDRSVHGGADPETGAAVLLAGAPVPQAAWTVLVARPASTDSPARAALEQQRLIGGALAILIVLGTILVGRTARESIRRRDALAESLEQQSAISHVLEVIASSPSSLTPVFAAIESSSARLCRADGALTWLRSGEVLRCASERASAHVRDWSMPLERRYLVGRAVLEGRTIHLTDFHTDLEIDAEARQRFAPARTALAVPLRRRDEILGAIALPRFRVERFTPREVALVETFADQAAIAIENVRLFNETKESLEQQTATADVLKVISRSTVDLTVVLQTVLAAAARLCDADYGWLNQTDDTTPDLPIPRPDLHTGRWSRVGAFYGRTEELQRRADEAFNKVKPIGQVFPMYRQTATSLAILDRTVINVPDFSLEPELRASGFAKAIGARALLVVPLLRDSEAIGAIALVRLTTRAFTDREVSLAQTFADQAVIAIENVRLFNEIQDKSAQLAAASQHKSEFLANMSHELRTPLNAIIGFSDVLLEGIGGEVGPRAREYLGDIRTSGHHLLSLINDVLDLSKVEAGRMELELGRVSVAQLIEDAVLLVRERAARHGITVASDVPMGIADMEADGRKLKQVLLNLLSNAVKFTRDGGWVGVTVRTEADDLVISVRDTGVGIPPEDQARIFEEFRQSSRRDARTAEGTGLGLALTKRFAELHNGHVAVESEIGKGSTFTVRLPMRQPAVVH